MAEEVLDTSQVFPEGEKMHKYTTKNGKYVFFTDEPLTEEEAAELDEHQEVVIKLLMKNPGVKSFKVNAIGKV